MPKFEKNQSTETFSCQVPTTKQIRNYQNALLRDSAVDDVLFDDKLLEIATKYAKNPAEISHICGYLNSLEVNGRKFCRNRRTYSLAASTLQKFEAPEAAADGRWRSNYKAAKKIVSDRYSLAKQTVLPLNCASDVEELIGGLHTSTGYTRFITGYAHKDEFPPNELLQYVRLICEHAFAKGRFDSPELLGFRTQASGEFDGDGNPTNKFKEKTRPIQIVDLVQVIEELRFAKPMNRFLKVYPYSAIGKDDETINVYMNRLTNSCASILSLDYSAYDSSIPSWLQYDAFDILANAFGYSSASDDELLRTLRNSFIHKDILLADGMHSFHHGTPSGSGLTAIINGICNELITETWLCKYGLEAQYMIMGDDNIIFINGYADLQEVASYISYVFGVVVNADKSTSLNPGDAPEFLSREWTPWGPARCFPELVSRMLFPERWRPYTTGLVTPELVFYSYYLGYRKTMNENFYMERFFLDTGLKLKLSTLSRETLSQLPYNVRLAIGIK